MLIAILQHLNDENISKNPFAAASAEALYNVTLGGLWKMQVHVVYNKRTVKPHISQLAVTVVFFFGLDIIVDCCSFADVDL